MGLPPGNIFWGLISHNSLTYADVVVTYEISHLFKGAVNFIGFKESFSQ